MALPVAWLLAALLSALGAVPALACGPYDLVTFFWNHRGQDLPLARLAAGEITPFERLRPLEAFVVYRLLRDRPLDAHEQARVVACCGELHDTEPEASLRTWLDARSQVAGAERIHMLNTYRNGPDYSYYANCLDDAFRTATHTLTAHQARWGKDSPEVRQWLDAQDQVFANCHKGTTIPEPLAESDAPRLRFDRAYQIAAAHLYAGAWAEAEQRFLRIADQPESPWHAVSGLVAARAMVRQGKLEAAVAHLRTIIETPHHAVDREDAEGYLRYTRYQLEPARQHAETRAALLGERLPDDFERVWTDYLWGLRATPDYDHELDLWMTVITSKRYHGDFTGKQGLRKRRADAPNDRLWHLAALARSEADWPERDALVHEGPTAPADAPEADAVRFHQARLLLAQGDVAAARPMVDALATRSESWPDAARNRLQTLRALAAPDLRTFVETAHGKPTAVAWGGDHETDLAYHEVDPDAPLLLDIAQPLVQHLPIETLRRLITEARLPELSRNHLLSVTFSRALIVGDDATALALAPEVAERLPELAGGAKSLLATSPDEREITAALILLWSPTASPFFHYGAQPPWHWGWWCQPLELPVAGQGWLDPVRQAFVDDSPMPEAERNALTGMRTAPEHLSDIVFQWAEARPDHPRIPEALHRVVVLTRRACGTLYGTISKRAFDLLHQRYPNDPWTAKTPYWFGD